MEVKYDSKRYEFHPRGPVRTSKKVNAGAYDRQMRPCYQTRDFAVKTEIPDRKRRRRLLYRNRPRRPEFVALYTTGTISGAGDHARYQIAQTARKVRPDRRANVFVLGLIYLTAVCYSYVVGYGMPPMIGRTT